MGSGDEGTGEKRHRRRHKHKRRHKRRRRHDTDDTARRRGGERDASSSSGYASDQDPPTPATTGAGDGSSTANPVGKVTREGWMSAPEGGLFGRQNAKEEAERQAREEEEARKARAAAAPQVHRRELNPYLRAGVASGMPNEPTEGQRAGHAASAPVVGDGGASWRAKALRRASERAREDGKQGEGARRVDERLSILEEREKAKQERERQRQATHQANEDWKRSRGGGGGGAGSSTQDYQHRKDRDPNYYENTTATRAAAAPATTNVPSSSSSIVPKMETVTIVKGGGGNVKPVNLNKLHAQLVKAEMMGDEQKIAKLKASIDKAKKAGITATGPSQTQEKTQVVVVNRGLSADEARLRDSALRTGKGRLATHDSDGERVRYFEDDDRSLTDLVAEARRGDVASIDRALGQHIARDGRYTDQEQSEYDDLGSEMKSVGGANKSRQHIKNADKKAEKQRQVQIQKAVREQQQLDRCPLCYSNPKRWSYTTIATGTKAYLAIPSKRGLVPYHCTIMPMEHVSSSLECDEDTWQEIRNFKKCLVRLYASKGMDVLFMETVMGLKYKPHTFIDVIPVSRDAGAEAPMYFTQEINECDSKSTSHKKRIDTQGKDFRRCIPSHFPFFHVEFGMSGGYAHVIEDEQKFPRLFGRSVVCGIMDIEANRYTNPAKLPEEALRRVAEEFKQVFKPFDWTRQLAQ